MRRAARVDANQSPIVCRLRELGASVLLLFRVGDGCPDLLIGLRGRNYLAEVKDGEKSWSLTPDQRDFHAEWKGERPFILDSVAAATAWVQKVTAP